MLAVANSNDTMVCLVCGHRLRQPRILPCLHTFCTDCIFGLQTYPIMNHPDYCDVTDSEVDWFPTRDNDLCPDIDINLCPDVDIVKPPTEFDSSDYPWSTPPRSRNKQRQVKARVTRSKSCSEKLKAQEKRDHHRPRSLNRSSSGNRDRTENILLRSRRDLRDNYNNSVTPTASPILTDRNRIIMCPVCWREVQVSTSLQELPRNLIAERYLTQDVARCLGTILTCDLCNDISNTHDDDNDESARSSVTVRCVDCYEYLCSLCETAHRRQKRTNNHTLVGVDQLLDTGCRYIPVCTSTEFVSDSLSTPEINGVTNNCNLLSLTTFNYLLGKDSQDYSLTSERSVPGQHLESDQLSHRRLNFQLEHQVDIQHSPSANIAGFRDVSTNIACYRQGRTATCLEHPGQELKMFCVTCELNVCLDCVILKHRTHDCQFVTRELFQSQMDDVDRLIQAVIPKVRAFDDQIKSLTQMKNRVVERSNEVKGEVNAFIDNFVEAVQIHRKHLLMQVASLCENKDKALSMTQDDLLQARADVEQTCQFLGELLTSATDVEILSLKQLLVHRLTSIRDVPFRPHFQEHDFLRSRDVEKHDRPRQLARFCPTIKGEVINNFQMFGRVIAKQPSAVDSVLHGDGLHTARLERKCVMVLSVFDSDRVPYNDNDITIDARIFYQGKEINVPVNIVHLMAGAHQISFIPVYEGTHFLHVGVNGCSVQDSPFKFHVKAKWRRHVGTWVTSNPFSGKTDTDHVFNLDTSTEGGPTVGQPAGHYWSCCGKMTYSSECGAGRVRKSPVRQATF